jgi:hypothetical protein
MTRRLGIDLDGCLANFTDSYAKVITKHTGIHFPKASDKWPTVWYWEREAGVTKEQEKQVWGEEILNPLKDFWFKLAPMEGAVEVVRRLNWLGRNGCDVYFLTHRMGDTAKTQTERWLYELGMNFPTVILAGDKAPIIKALGINIFVDDKWETINGLYTQALEEEWKGINIWLKDTPYNREGRGKWLIADSVQDALEKEGLM